MVPRDADVRTVGAVDLAAPPAGTEPDAAPRPRRGGPPPDPGRHGSSAASPPCSVTASASIRCGSRIGFVLLALAGGIGLLVYAGLWLVLVAGRSSRPRLAALRRRGPSCSASSRWSSTVGAST